MKNFFDKYKKLPLFDFSNFQKKITSYILIKIEKPYFFSKMKILVILLKKFIGLRSKLYVIKTVSNEIDKNVKDNNRKFKDTLLTYEKYKRCHQNLKMCRLPLVTIRGFDHRLYTVLQNKVVLNNFDSKMYICDCNIHTYFYGSKDLKKCMRKNVIEIYKKCINVIDYVICVMRIIHGINEIE